METYKRKFTGSNYQSGLTTKDIKKLVLKELKYIYPNSTFSIRTTYNTISISLMKSDLKVFADLDLEVLEHEYRKGNYYCNLEEFKGYLKQEVESGQMLLNPFWVEENYKLTKEAKKLFKDTLQIVNSYNYDDSESMIDYFDTSFYLDLEIGRFEKPFIKL